MKRHSRITEKMPREFVLLQGTGCRWRRCVFCDYHLDVSAEPFAVNREVLACVTGEFGVLDVINSGSCVELDEQTVAMIADVAEKRRIHTIWFEAHWMYREQLAAFAGNFPGVRVRFRTGAETFDAGMRRRWDKGIPDGVTARDIAQHFDGVCLLVCVEGQTRDMITRDIETALRHFKYFSVNLFTANTTAVRRDEGLVRWFMREWYGRLSAEPRAEVLLGNTDLGVGG